MSKDYWIVNNIDYRMKLGTNSKGKKGWNINNKYIQHKS